MRERHAMDDLLKTVRNTIDHHALLTRGGTIVVGVSGGPDSLCLLHVLRTLAPEYGVTLHVAHLNHQLRGTDADEDATFVAQLAAEWGLLATFATRDVTAYAERERLAIEEAARQMRKQAPKTTGLPRTKAMIPEKRHEA